MRGRKSARWFGRHPAVVVGLVLVLALVGASCSSGGSSGTSGAALPTYSVFVQKFRYHGLPSSLKSGEVVIDFSNHENLSITHEMVLVSLPSGKTGKDITADAKTKGTKSEDDWLHFGEIPDVDTGATKAQVFDLPAGRYAIACWETGNLGGGTGKPHVARGMVFDFNVS
jgi:hypothetical protein